MSARGARDDDLEGDHCSASRLSLKFSHVGGQEEDGRMLPSKPATVTRNCKLETVDSEPLFLPVHRITPLSVFGHFAPDDVEVQVA